jgi:hypothetical protein
MEQITMKIAQPGEPHRGFIEELLQGFVIPTEMRSDPRVSVRSTKDAAGRDVPETGIYAVATDANGVEYLVNKTELMHILTADGPSLFRLNTFGPEDKTKERLQAIVNQPIRDVYMSVDDTLYKSLWVKISKQ